MLQTSNIFTGGLSDFWESHAGHYVGYTLLKLIVWGTLLVCSNFVFSLNSISKEAAWVKKLLPLVMLLLAALTGRQRVAIDLEEWDTAKMKSHLVTDYSDQTKDFLQMRHEMYDDVIQLSNLGDIPRNDNSPIVYNVADYKKYCHETMDLSSFSKSQVTKIMNKKGPNILGCGMLYTSTGIEKNTSINDQCLYFESESDQGISSFRTSTKAQAVSNFLSNFTEPRMSAPYHATLVNSLALQCSGTKVWFFVKPECLKSVQYAGATLAYSIDNTCVIKVVTTRPGYALTFGPYQHHAVVTHSGPSYLMTARLSDAQHLAFATIRFGPKFVKHAWNARQQHTRQVRTARGVETARDVARDTALDLLCNNVLSVEMSDIAAKFNINIA
jgi:hypothetical protein